MPKSKPASLALCKSSPPPRLPSSFLSPILTLPPPSTSRSANPDPTNSPPPPSNPGPPAPSSFTHLQIGQHSLPLLQSRPHHSPHPPPLQFLTSPSSSPSPLQNLTAIILLPFSDPDSTIPLHFPIWSYQLLFLLLSEFDHQSIILPSANPTTTFLLSRQY